MRVQRVLQVIPSVAPQRGGPSIMVRTLACGLVNAGVDTHIATTTDGGRGHLDVACGVPLLEHGACYWYFRRQTHFYSCSWPLTRWLQTHVADYDVVHIHALFSYPTAVAAYWAKKQDVPYVIRPLGTLNRWGMQQRRPLLKKLSFQLVERQVLQHAAAIHYTAEQEREEAAEVFPAGRTEIIPNPVQTPSVPGIPGSFRARYPELKDRKVILFLSRLDTKKGLDLLLPAFAQVRLLDPSAVLVLAGSGSREFVSGIEQNAAELGISGDILWTGFLEGRSKYDAFADADIFVLPSRSENFGIAPVEAMAAGLPVIISDQVAVHRDISAADAGVVVPCEIEALAQSITKLLGDPDRLSNLARNGRELARKRYSIEAVTAQMIDLYTDVARSGRKS